MAVSKRTRYEVLRRDGFACRYCGAKAPDVQLTVDHVVPTALGGADDPSNLVAACRDCNAGKASTKPTDEVVADVDESAARWARAIAEAARRSEERTKAQEQFLARFWDVWHGYTTYIGDEHFPVSPNCEATLLNYQRAGLTHTGLVDAIKAAMNKQGIGPYDRFPYFCGVVRNKLQALAEEAAALIERGEI